VRLLLTGGTSFTGLWFAEALAASGAQVVAPIRGSLGSYAGVRATRARRLAAVAEVIEGVSFGDDAFLALIGGQGFDALCHHAARVADYRSPDFDVPLALAENTRNLRQVLEVMRGRGLRAVIATGSVFEPDEGLGERPRRAFSPYGLSKGMSWQAMRYWCGVLEVPLGKFVIANPFGPFEEPRFCSSLIDTWSRGETAEVRTPLYLRDNIHADLLGLAYAGFVREVVATGRDARLGPSGYRETQGAFAERFAAEMRRRLGLECRLVLARQREFAEPMVRLNRDTLDAAGLGWDEENAWNALAAYYRG
jgi:nucleoside-diphosphate-sugar epimerase